MRNKSLSPADNITGDDILSNKKIPAESVLSGFNTDNSFTLAADIDAEHYLGFASNGMTDNEKIDDFDYYYDFLDKNGETV